MMSTNNTPRRMMALAGALAITAAGGLARAQQSSDDKPIKGSFDQPLRDDGDAQGDSNSTTMMSESDGEHTYTVKIQNGKVVSAEVDGQKIPKSRIKNKNGKIEILDEDGNVEKTLNMHVMAMPHAPAFPGGALTVRPWNGQGGGDQAMTLQGPLPPVMMGITMSDAPEGESGVVVDSVLGGLPAEKAGLEVGDRIISADGKKLESQQALRDILKDKKPGDTVELKIERDGKSKNVSIKLAKFEAQRLQGMNGAVGGPVMTFHNSNEEALENAKKALQKALDDIKSNESLKADKIKAKAEQALNEAMESLEKAKDELSMKADELHNQLIQQFGEGKWKQLFSDQGGQFVVPPGAPAAPGAAPAPDVSKQLDRLSQQIERLNKRLDQLEKDKK